MTIARRLGFIALGYVAAVAIGIAVVVAQSWFISAEAIEQSGGMVAFGQLGLFVLVTAGACLVPTWFLTKLLAERAPGVLLTMLLAVAVLGPLSWAVVVWGDGAFVARLSGAAKNAVGMLIAFVAIPRIIAGPVVLIGEAVAAYMLQRTRFRSMVAVAMLLDIVPLLMFAWHLVRATAR